MSDSTESTSAVDGRSKDCRVPDQPDPLLAYRAEFPILAQTNYLISNSLGAVPRSVESSLQSYYETWANRGVRAWEEAWWMMVAELGDLVAPLIGARDEEVVFHPYVTLAHAVVFSALDYSTKRNGIVTDSMHFPSILYLIDQERSRGASVTVVPSEDGISVDTERLLESIDENTALVNVSHVFFKSALHPRYRRDRRQAAAGRCDHAHRRISGGWYDPGGRPRRGCRRLYRRLFEMAVRRAGRGVLVG